MIVQRTIEVINHELVCVRSEYEHWFSLPQEMLSFKPAVGWSIEQILEHVTLTNYFLLILIRKGKKKAIEQAAKVDLKLELRRFSSNLDELDAIANNEAFKWIRPEHMEPTGEKSLQEVRSLLEEQLGECHGIITELSNGEGVLYKTTMSVNGLGKIDVYQYVYFLCQHAKRHVKQMMRVQEEFELSDNTSAH